MRSDDWPDQPQDSLVGIVSALVVGVLLAEVVFCTGCAAYFT